MIAIDTQHEILLSTDLMLPTASMTDAALALDGAAESDVFRPGQSLRRMSLDQESAEK
ncbi:hypothetical protein [Oleiagrimonas sp.]|uniref:hypothetical protein n=1 Tax=Oleiagrimonas sp. TaxID=2010330 RepID=UPI00262A53A4|nr:hypothetical protein [Oleiagrimonas sp.]MDA3914890.1 hypothetical protein [Oleiagrimonas sp.]